MPQSPDIGQNSDGVISDFPISGQSLIKENCLNSITSDDIDMKLGPITKCDKRNKTMSKFDDDAITQNCDVIVIFPILSQFAAVQRPDTESAKFMFSVIVTFCLTKTVNRNKKSVTQLLQY